MVSEAQTADTPVGNPVAVPIPVAPVVVSVMAVRVVFAHKVGFDEAVPALLAGVTVIDPVAFTAPQLPTNGMI